MAIIVAIIVAIIFVSQRGHWPQGSEGCQTSTGTHK